MDYSMLGKLVQLIMTVPADWLGTLVDLIEKLTGKNGKEWFDNLKLFLRKEQSWIRPLFTKLISGAETLTLDPTDGKETIVKAGDLFKVYLDSDFVNLGLD